MVMTAEEKDMAKEMGIRLNMLRVRRGYSQAELADALNCTQAFVSEWQCGKKLISTKYLFRISKLFGVSLDFFNPENKEYLQYLDRE